MVHVRDTRPETTECEVFIDSPDQVESEDSLSFLFPNWIFMKSCTNLGWLDYINEDSVVDKSKCEGHTHYYDQDIRPVVTVLFAISKDDSFSACEVSAVACENNIEK